MKLVVDEHIPYIRGVFEPYFQVKYLPGGAIDSKSIRDANALIIRTRTLCNETLLKGSKVQFIASATIGYDHIDTQYCDSHAIAWRNAPGCNAAAVQQWVAAVMVKWIKVKGKSFHGLTLGVVGVGNVGSKVVNLGKALGMNVVYCDPPRAEAEGLSDFITLDELLRVSDIITFHVPLTFNGKYPTYHMLDSSNLHLCKPTVLVINSSRGGVVDEISLLEFLNHNPNAEAAIDVWENEPSYNSQFAKRTLVATPHIAGYSLEGKVMATKMVVDSISQYFGLGIDPWWPTPNPLEVKISIEENKSLLSLVERTYDIEADDIRKQTCSFEEYRNTYAFRRDFSGFRVHSETLDSNLLQVLGFQVDS